MSNDNLEEEIMNDEKYKSIKSLPDGVEEIIDQFRNNESLTGYLQNNKKIFDDFTSLLSELNKIITEKDETEQRYSQISLF